MVRGSRSEMDASDIATSESRSEELGKGMSFCCFPFYNAGVRRVTRVYADAVRLTVGATSSKSSENFLLRAIAKDEDERREGWASRDKDGAERDDRLDARG